MEPNKQKAIAILSLLVAVESGVSTGVLNLTHMVPELWIPTITAWCGFLAFVGSSIIALLTGQSIMNTPAVKAAIFLALGVVFLLTSSPVFAQNRLQDLAQRNDVNRPGGAAPVSPLIGGGGLKTPDELIQKLVSMNLADFKYAKARAKAASNSTTLPCWSAWVDLLEKAQASLKDDSGAELIKPDPHLFSDLEAASELLQALQVGGPIQIGCAPMADAAKKSVAQLIGGILGGGSALGGLIPFPIP